MVDTDGRLAELLELTDQARKHALTGAYEPIARATRDAADEFEPAIRLFLSSGRVDAAMAMITGLHTFWQDNGLVDLGQELAELALETAAGVPGVDRSLRARTMLTAGEMAFRQGNQKSARAWSESAVAEAVGAGDQVTAALAEVSLARIAFRDGDADGIESWSRQALERAGSDAVVQRAAFHMLAWAAHTAGDRRQALEWFERSLEVRRAMGDPFGIAVELANLGDIALETGDLGRAAGYIEDALSTAVRLENLYLLTSLIGSAGTLAGEAGMAEEAVTLLAAADAAYASTSLVPDPGTREMMDAAAAKARAALGPDGAELAEAVGRAMTLSAAASRAVALCRELRTSNG